MKDEFRVLIHLDDTPHTSKPADYEAGITKSKFRYVDSVKSKTLSGFIEAVAENGQSWAGGIGFWADQDHIPQEGGISAKDFIKGHVFAIDIDNKVSDLPNYLQDNPPEPETPFSLAEKLKEYNIIPAFMYPTLSSVPLEDGNPSRFRCVIFADDFTFSRREYEMVQEALAEVSDYADKRCKDACRIFYGGKEGAVRGYTNPDAIMSMENLVAFADDMQEVIKERKAKEDEWEMEHFTLDDSSLEEGQDDKKLKGFNRQTYAKYIQKIRSGENFVINESNEGGHDKLAGRDDAIASFAFGSWVAHDLDGREEVIKEVREFNEHFNPKFNASFVTKKIRQARSDFIKKIRNNPNSGYKSREEYIKEKQKERDADLLSGFEVLPPEDGNSADGPNIPPQGQSTQSKNNIPPDRENGAKSSENEPEDPYMEGLKQQVSIYNRDYVDGFKSAIHTANYITHTPTGIDELDEILKGGLFPGLITLGGVTGCGKTTLATQIADHIAAQGRDVMYFSLEMDRHEMMARSISRMCAEQVKGEFNKDDDDFWIQCESDEEYDKLNRDLMLDADAILTPERKTEWTARTKEKVNDTIETYRQTIGEHLQYICSIGSLNTRQVKELVIHHLKSCKEKGILTPERYPVVFIDYLQIMTDVPECQGQGDKQRIDRAVLDLKRLARDYQIPIIEVSSLNRNNYKEPGGLASFKESGAIEYTSDVVLLLQLDGMGYQLGDSNRPYRIHRLEEKASERKKNGDWIWLELEVLKNRRGTTGKMLIDYNSRYNLFRKGDASQRGEIRLIFEESRRTKPGDEPKEEVQPKPTNYTQDFKSKRARF